MKALAFVIPKHSLQWRGEFSLYLGHVAEYLLVNSAVRWSLMAACVEGKFLSSFLYFMTSSLIIFGMSCYYMPLSHKDWELPNSWIWLAETDIDRGLDFPI